MHPRAASFPRTFGAHQGGFLHALALAALLAAHALLFARFAPAIGGGLAAGLSIPAMLAGWWFGPRRGLLFGSACLPAHTALALALGMSAHEAFLAALPAYVVTLAAAFGAGRVADLVEARAEAEARFRTLADTALDGFVIHENGTIREANAAFERSFGYEPGGLEGRSVFDLLDESSFPAARAGLARGGRQSYSLTGRTRSGAAIRLEAQADDTRYHGRPARIIALRDVTQREAVEAAVRASEARFRTLFENTSIGLYRTTPDGRILLANPALVRMLGHSSFEELAARDLNAEDQPGPSASYSRRDWMRTIDNAGEVVGMEAVWRGAGGRKMHVRESARAVRDASGRVLHYEGTVEDITARKEAEEALREKEALLRKVFETSPVGMVFADFDGRAWEANDAFLRIVGYTREDLEKGLSTTALTAPEHTLADQRAKRELLTTGTSVLYEKEYVRKDGTRAPVMVTSALVGDARRHIVKFVLDVRDRQRARRELAASEARKSAILEASLDCVVTFDEAGRIVELNAAAERTLRCERAHVLGTDIRSIVDTAAAPAEQGALVGSRVEVLARRADGAEFPAELTIVPVESASGPLFTAFMRDLTDIKRLEAERAAQQERLAVNERLGALGTLVAGVAHEINNPLTYITGNIELARMDLLDAADALHAADPGAPDLRETAKALESALGGAERIGHITRALKAVARQRETAERELVDVRAVLANVSALLRVGIPDHITLECKQGPEPLHIWANASELHQVVLNLARNAFDAVAETSDALVTLQCQAEATGVALTVRDNGSGITADVLSRIFTPFYTTKKQGTGLGLSIVHGIVKDHGGEIAVVSAPGEGAAFTVHLPAAPAAACGTRHADGQRAK